MAKTKLVKKPRRAPRRLSHTLYVYSEPVNGEFARDYGRKNFGSFSAYVDALIAADRKAAMNKQAKLVHPPKEQQADA